MARAGTSVYGCADRVGEGTVAREKASPRLLAGKLHTAATARGSRLLAPLPLSRAPLGLAASLTGFPRLACLLMIGNRFKAYAIFSTLP